MVLLWAAGIFLAAVVLPFGERLVEQALHIPPIDTELVRGMRYFVPLMLLFWLWPLAELAPRLADARAGRSRDAGRHSSWWAAGPPPIPPKAAR